MPGPIGVYLETGSKRTFACAVDWPGWSRSGKTPDAALEALVASSSRFAHVVRKAGLRGFEAPQAVASLQVVQRIKGGSGTDFGVPSETPRADRQDLDQPELERQMRLLKASWTAFDRAAAAAKGAELRKGPRGGGRDLGKIVQHVLEAEEAYLSQLGSRVPKLEGATSVDAMTRVRDLALEVLAQRARAEPLADPNRVKKTWLPRYFVRRSAWHALDHAWEIENRVVT